MWFKQNESKSPQQSRIPATEAAPAQVTPAAAPAPPGAGLPAFAEPPRSIPPPAPAAAAPMASNASRITAGITVKGEISGSEELWVGGHVEGTLRFAGARIVVSNSGSVRGGMEAREIVVEGRQEGDLRAAERLAVSRSGQVRGDAAAPRVAIEEGAVFNGAIEVIREGEPRSTFRASAGAAPSGASTRPARAASSHAASAAAPSVPVSPSAGIAATGAGSASGLTSGASSSETAIAARSLALEPATPDSE
jgi:cytoskeletal protein CcmA (bactofilin family)